MPRIPEAELVLNIELKAKDVQAANELAKSFICSLCQVVVLNPVQCQSCETLFCRKCNNLRSEKHTMCNCGAKFIQKKIDKHIYNTLAQFEFKCNQNDCGEIFLHENAEKHAKECQSRPAKRCVLNCGEESLMKEQKMQDHLRNRCPNAKGVCGTCKL